MGKGGARKYLVGGDRKDCDTTQDQEYTLLAKVSWIMDHEACVRNK